MKTKAGRIFLNFTKLYAVGLAKEANGVEDIQRMELMQNSNPRYMLRQWMVRRAILNAEKDDLSEVRLLYKVLSAPLKPHPEAELAGCTRHVPGWSKQLVISCSS